MRGGVFVCHAAEDAGTAQRVVAALEAANIPCWIAPRDIEPGQNWAEAILAGIAAAPAMVLMFSAAANGSEHVPRELGTAVERGLPIVPVRLEQVDPSPRLLYFIGQAHWLEADGVGAQQWESPLVRAVRHAVNRQQTPPTTVIPKPGDQGSSGTRPRRRRWLWGGAAALAVVLVIGLVVVLLNRPGEKDEETAHADDGPVPSGRAGMATVFSSVDEPGCVSITPHLPGKTEVVLCQHLDEGYQVRYSRWKDDYDPADWYDGYAFDAESGTWILGGQEVGRRWQYFHSDDTKLPYRWSAAYRDLPFSVDVEAATSKQRSTGEGTIKAAAPDEIRRQ